MMSRGRDASVMVVGDSAPDIGARGSFSCFWGYFRITLLYSIKQGKIKHFYPILAYFRLEAGSDRGVWECSNDPRWPDRPESDFRARRVPEIDLPSLGSMSLALREIGPRRGLRNPLAAEDHTHSQTFSALRPQRQPTPIRLQSEGFKRGGGSAPARNIPVTAK